MSLSDKIISIRMAKNISQSAIAKSMGIEPSNYPRLEKRGSKLTLEQVEKIAEALGVSVLELLDEGKQGEHRTQLKKAFSDDLEKQLINAEERIKLLEEQLKDKKQIIKFYEYKFGRVSNSIDMFLYDLIILESERNGYRKYYSLEEVNSPNRKEKFVSLEEWNQLAWDRLFYSFHDTSDEQPSEVSYAEFITLEDAKKCLQDLFGISGVREFLSRMLERIFEKTSL
jgi:transcriptional regulator with XRE-family HTH domain